MEGLQTLPFGSKSQVIGAKEQGPKRACGCPLVYMRLVSPFPLQSSCKAMSQAFSARAGDGDAKRHVEREGAYGIVRAHRAQSSSMLSAPECGHDELSFITCEGLGQSGTRSIKAASKTAPP